MSLIETEPYANDHFIFSYNFLSGLLILLKLTVIVEAESTQRPVLNARNLVTFFILEWQGDILLIGPIQILNLTQLSLDLLRNLILLNHL